jgi:hypothetical protein
VGFNASLMADAPYAVIVAPAGVSERRMANHAAGAALAASVPPEPVPLATRASL